jgi:hypothetical protein
MKILLLDAAFGAIPIFEALVSGDHEVWVMGNRPNDVLAQKAGRRWINEDYSKIEKVRAHVANQQFDRIVPGCTDTSIDICAKLERINYLLDPPATNLTLSNKAAFRRLCGELSLSAPRLVERENFPLAGQFICKPVDAFSGNGVTVFDGGDLQSLKRAYATALYASQSGGVLIESFAAGELYSCSAFIERQKVVKAFYVREGSSANPFAVDTSYVVDDLPMECQRQLIETIETICVSLSLRDGLLHTQFILGQDNDPSIIEIARRCPGDLYSLLIEYSTGYPYAAKYASYFIGEALDARADERRYVLRHTVTSGEESGIFTGLQLRGPISLRAYYPINALGHHLLPNQGSRAGILFSEAPTSDRIVDLYRHFVERHAYDVI